MKRLKLWWWGKLFILLVALGCGPHRRRMSHNNGVAGKGWLKIVDNPKFPDTEFFEPGKKFPCRLRHACVAYMDDSMHVARSCTIKFSDTDFKSPFDLQANTGRHAFFWNAKTFLQFAFWRKESGGIEYVKYYREYSRGRKAAASAFRRNPTSYTRLYFHSQTPFLWTSKDGTEHYVKFRILPHDKGEESARPTDEMIKEWEESPDLSDKIGDQRVLEGEDRNINYLKNEWKERVESEGAHYWIQLQLHEVKDDDEPEVRDPHIYWDEESHPWMDLAEVHIEELLSYEDECKLTFEFTHMPSSMAMLKPTDMEDFNSLNYMRAQSGFAIKARWFFQKIRGLPKHYGDDSPHNLNPKGM